MKRHWRRKRRGFRIQHHLYKHCMSLSITIIVADMQCLCCCHSLIGEAELSYPSITHCQASPFFNATALNLNFGRIRVSIITRLTCPTNFE